MKPSSDSSYPVFVDLRDKTALLVGGGEVALRKAQGLAGTGCRLTVVAKAFCPAFQGWLERHPCRVERRAYRDGEATQYFLVISATDDAEVNRRVFEDARGAERLINVVDQPRLCNIYIPSRIERGDLQIAISSGGTCPAFSRWLRLELEEAIPERYGPLLQRLAAIRRRIQEAVPSSAVRKRILERLLRSEAVRRFLSGDDQLLSRLEKGWERARPQPK